MDPAAVRQLAIAVVPSVLVSVLVLWPLWWRVGRGGADGAARAPGPWWAAGLVFAGLVAVLFGVAEGRFYLPPLSRKDWVPVIAVAGAVVGLVLGAAGPAGGVGRMAVRVVVAAAVGLACAWPKVTGGWTPGESAAWLGAFVGLAALAWWAIERVTERERGAQGSLAVMLLAGGASQVLVLGYASFDQAQLATMIAAASGPMWVLGMLRPGFALARGGAVVAVLVVAAATFQSALYGSAEGLPRWAMGGLVAASPVMGLVADVGVLSRRGGLTRGIVRAGAMGLAAAGAVALGVLMKAEPMY